MEKPNQGIDFVYKPQVYTLVFSDSDLGELQRLMDDLFSSNNLVFERLVSALSRLGLKVTIASTIAVFPVVEVVKKQIVQTLKKGLSHVQKAQ